MLNQNIFQYNRPTWQKLVDKILNGKIILFVGAGLSHGSGFPDWPGLIEKLCEKCGKITYSGENYKKNGATYLQGCADSIESYATKSDLIRWIRDIVENSPSSRNLDLQRRIINLLYKESGGVIITTNYDRFLETAAEDIIGHQTHAYPYTLERTQSLHSVLNLTSPDHEGAINRQLHIFKLHGDTSSTELVLSKRSYNAAYNVSDDAPSAISASAGYTRGILDELYHQDILFLGCSLSDPYFKSEWRGKQTSGEWFVLYPTDRSPEDIEAALSSEYNNTENPINQQIKSLNIHAIYYKIDDMTDSKKHNKCISMFLEELEHIKNLASPMKICSVADLNRAEADSKVIALEFCPWTREDDKYDLALGKFNNLRNRLKRVVFSKDYPQNEISEKAFMNFTDLYEVQLCSNIKIIRNEAFSGCSSLKFIYTLNGDNSDNFHHNRLENIQFLGRNAFHNCNALEHIDFSQSTNLRRVSEEAFECCESLLEVRLPSSLKSLDAGCFRNCTNLRTINWTDLCNLKSIGQQAFLNCVQLSSIYLPSQLETLGDGSFQNAKKAVLAGLDACSLEKIPQYAFNNCDKITSVIFSDTVTTISLWAMAGCDELRKVVIPSSIKQIEASAFAGCKKLNSIVFISDEKIIIDSSAFSQCSPEYQKEIDRVIEAHKREQ